MELQDKAVCQWKSRGRIAPIQLRQSEEASCRQCVISGLKEAPGALSSCLGQSWGSFWRPLFSSPLCAPWIEKVTPNGRAFVHHRTVSRLTVWLFSQHQEDPKLYMCAWVPTRVCLCVLQSVSSRMSGSHVFKIQAHCSEVISGKMLNLIAAIKRKYCLSQHKCLFGTCLKSIGIFV